MGHGRTRRKAYVLCQEVNYFGRVIPRGTVYEESERTKDYYIPDILDRGILMSCPALELHFTTVKNNDEFFIEIYY